MEKFYQDIILDTKYNSMRDLLGAHFIKDQAVFDTLYCNIDFYNIAVYERVSYSYTDNGTKQSIWQTTTVDLSLEKFSKDVREGEYKYCMALLYSNDLEPVWVPAQFVVSKVLAEDLFDYDLHKEICKTSRDNYSERELAIDYTIANDQYIKDNTPIPF